MVDEHKKQTTLPDELERRADDVLYTERVRDWGKAGEPRWGKGLRDRARSTQSTSVGEVGTTDRAWTPGCPRMAEVHAYGGRFRVRFMFLDGKECNTGTTITCSAGSSQTCDKSWTQDWDHRQHSEASLPGVARHAFHRPVAETHRATSTEDVEYEVIAWVSQNLQLGALGICQPESLGYD
jgi:hypothetical protein